MSSPTIYHNNLILMKKLLPLLLFLWSFQLVLAQDRPKQSDLQKQLRESRPDTGRINALLGLAEFQITKHGSYKTDLDSAAAYIHDAEQLNLTVRSAEATGYIIMEQSSLARESGDKKTGQMLIQKAIQQLSGTGNKLLQAKAYLKLADYYDYSSPVEYPKKVTYTENAANLFKAGGYLEQAAFCDRNLAEIMSDEDNGFRKLNESLAIYNAIHYKRLQGVYDLFAAHYREKSDYETALKYDLKALITEESLHDHDGTLAEIENHIGMTYSRLHDLPNQIRFYKMGLATARSIGDVNSTIILTLNLAYSYLTAKQPSVAESYLASVSKNDFSHTDPRIMGQYHIFELEGYNMLKQYAKAKQAALNLLQIIRTGAFGIQNEISAYEEIIKYYLESGQYAEAKKYLLQSDTDVKKENSPIDIQEANGYWFRLDTAVHDYKSAVHRMLVKQEILDSMNKVNNSNEIKKLQIQFDTKENEQQIAFLKRSSLLEAQNLQQAYIVKDYTIGGIILLLFLAGLLYRQNLHKQKNNKVISTKNVLLQQLLDEKEWLLKEVHHRVKNNLHTVICLLESQAAYLENDALKAIENSQHRIYAMSLIHQKLYQSDDVKTIDMDVYLKEFTQYLEDSFGNPPNIKLQSEIEPIKLGVAQAIPVGLIINEAVTNSYKYAFPGNREGIIKVTLHQSENLIELIVSDDGIGMAIVDNTDEAGSLGMELIKGLARDLNGQLKLDGKNGASLRILFEVNLLYKVISNQKLPVLT